MSFKIVLIGCGRIGVLLEDDPLRSKPATHIGGIQFLLKNHNTPKNLILSAVCDIDSNRLSQCMKKYQIEKGYSHYKEIILAEKPDIVIIATWTSSHKDIAVFAAENGVKGIVLEKPIAVSIRQAHEIIHTCNLHNVKLVINHERRWDCLYRKTAEIISSKTLGELKTIYANVLSRSAPRGDWKNVLNEAGGGPLLHDGTHLVDMIRYFAGDIASVSGHVTREDPSFGTETTATAFMQTQSQVNIFLEAGGMRDYFNFEIDLHFERGRIRVGNGISDYFTTQNSGRYTGFYELIKTPFPSFIRNMNPFTGALLEVIDAIEKDTQPFSSGIDGLRAIEIIFAVYYSASLGGKKISLPLKTIGHPLKRMFKKGMI